PGLLTGRNGGSGDPQRQEPFSFIGCERSDHGLYSENRPRSCFRRVRDPAEAPVVDPRRAGVTLKA
ncbi:MAG: hypothetical protein JXD18_09660, partial [Anaerolineae bacterium]|nr:hypothetical protein [Anaerolineae bacterium]